MNTQEFIEHSCLTCEHFAWWDGDYCCIDKFKILMPAPRGNFNKDMIDVLKNKQQCKRHKKSMGGMSSIYVKQFEKFLKENNYEI